MTNEAAAKKLSRTRYHAISLSRLLVSLVGGNSFWQRIGGEGGGISSYASCILNFKRRCRLYSRILENVKQIPISSETDIGLSERGHPLGVVPILNTRPKIINCRTVSTDENEMKALCFPIVATVPPFLPIFSRTISNAFYTSLSTRTYFRRGNACARERFVNGITRLKYGSNELWNLFEKVGSMIKRIWMKIFWLVRYILNFFLFFSYNFLLVIRPIQVKFSYARKLLNLIYSETKPQTKKIIFFFPRLISESSWKILYLYLNLIL